MAASENSKKEAADHGMVAGKFRVHPRNPRLTAGTDVFPQLARHPFRVFGGGVRLRKLF
jgi:hypothetical protein